MKPDIQHRLKKDFGDSFLEVVELINEWDVLYKGLLSDRVLRSVIFLANGDKEEFMNMMKLAKLDYRDLFMAAEYRESDDVRLRDFSRPFGQEELK